jgi:hypothetical protein
MGGLAPVAAKRRLGAKSRPYRCFAPAPGFDNFPYGKRSAHPAPALPRTGTEAGPKELRCPQ